jgi:hypothetical protein
MSSYPSITQAQMCQCSLKTDWLQFYQKRRVAFQLLFNCIAWTKRTWKQALFTGRKSDTPVTLNLDSPATSQRESTTQQFAEKPTTRIRASLQRCRKQCKISTGFSRCPRPTATNRVFPPTAKSARILVPEESLSHQRARLLRKPNKKEYVPLPPRSRPPLRSRGAAT